MNSAVALGCGLVGKFVIERLVERQIHVNVLDLAVPQQLCEHPLIDAI